VASQPGPETRRVAVVTGASGGIGSGIVASLTRAGFNMMVIGRTPEKLEALVKATPNLGRDEVIMAVCDVRKPEDLERAAAAARSRWGKVDVLCTAAGVMRIGALDEISTAEWQNLDLLPQNSSRVG
jgi:NADP-dependent 3-hydroxy acid dehydrogenase YdfG